MKMAYVAINPETKDCYAICAADPDFLQDAASEIAQWKKDGATVELLPRDEALKLFAKDLPESDKQMGLFEEHVAGRR